MCRFKIWASLSLFFILISCVASTPEAETYRNEDREKAHIRVSIEPQKETLYFSRLFASGTTVDLSGCKVSRVSKVFLLGDGRLIVFASRIIPEGNVSSSFRAAVFTPEGKYLYPLLRIGNGPEEVINVQDVQYNPYKNSFDVLSDYGRKIIRYDLETRKKVETILVDSKEIVCGSSFLPLDNDYVLIYKNLSYTRGREYKLYLCKLPGCEVVDRFLPFDKQTAETISSFKQRNNIFQVGKSTYFSEVFLNIIYKFESGKLLPFVGFKDNRYSLPDNLLHNKNSHFEELVENAVGASKIYFHTAFFLSGRHVFSSFKYLEDQQYFNVISIDEQESHSYDRICDDVCTGITASCKDYKFSVVGTDDNHVLFALETENNPMILLLQNSF